MPAYPFAVSCLSKPKRFHALLALHFNLSPVNRLTGTVTLSCDSPKLTLRFWLKAHFASA